MTLSIAREIAYDAFVAVMDYRRKPEDVLSELYKKHDKRLKKLDRNFIKELVYGSLRWNAKIYWILQKTSKRDLDKSSPEIRSALVVGTYQIYYMDRVPDRAAVNESVEYIRKKGQANACSFVNGILRQISRRAEYFAKPDKTTHPAEYLALQFSHPLWLVKRWLKQFKFEKLETMLSNNNQPPPVSVRINSLKVGKEDSRDLQDRLLREEKVKSDRRALRSALHLKQSPQFKEPSLFASGYFTIQDESSQLIAPLVSPEAGQTIVDACAGPGGKLSHVYELGNEEITLFAVEKDQGQYDKAKETMDRLGHDKVEWIHQDFLKWKAPKKVNKVLLDAPCTGLGVLRRHPEGRWHKEPSTFSGIQETQYKLILHALEQIRVGGELIYSVCSFEKSECEDHLTRLMSEYPDAIEVVSPVSRLPDYFKKYVTRKNILSIYAGNQDDMDGFSAMILKVKKRI